MTGNKRVMFIGIIIIVDKRHLNEKLLTKWYKVVKCGKIFDIFET
ncbi:hypothetical protein GCM10022257_03500 [Hyunsoonleella aestuarii]|uniref:Uncharacterized protein n=1 Tax=Hyunsoonleella aestuarii TaxID=912802 RepID=A0ABP8E7T9_9FLAO